MQDSRDSRDSRWYHSFLPGLMVLARLERLERKLDLILQNQEKEMSAIDDLKTAMTDLVNEAISDLETVIAKLTTIPPDDTAAIQALTQQASDTTAKLKADMAALSTPAAPPAASAATAG